MKSDIKSVKKNCIYKFKFKCEKSAENFAEKEQYFRSV